VKAICVIMILWGAFAAATAAQVQDAPAFSYDRSKTPVYLNQMLQASPHGPATDLRKELSAVLDEILDGPWQPLYSDYSAGEAGGVGTAEWCFIRPGDTMLALSLAARYMTSEQKDRASQYLRSLVKTCPPTQQVTLLQGQGKPRQFRRAPAPGWAAPSGRQAEWMLFTEAYAVWAYARAFDAWDEVRPLFVDLRTLRGQLEQRGDFAPVYVPAHAGPLTTSQLRDPEYRFTVYQSLLAGFQDNYGYRGAQEARRRMEKDQPVFFYVQHLSALIGYYRLACHFGQQDEADWAWHAFDRIATMTLAQKSAPHLWSDPFLYPEVGRLIRDAAGPWLDELARTANVGNLPAVDWNGQIVVGRRDNYVMNPYTWYHAWGGQGEGVRPRTVMGAFLVHAYLFNVPAPRVVQTLDIPWCRADLYYARKLVVAIQAIEGCEWVPTT